MPLRGVLQVVKWRLQVLVRLSQGWLVCLLFRGLQDAKGKVVACQGLRVRDREWEVCRQILG